MDPTKFDDLTKALATPTSRRQALKTIAATTLGSVLGLGRLSTAFGASKCHRNGLGCDTNSNCCSNYCANGKCTCPPAPACNDTCPCPSGQTCCNGTCSDCPCGKVKLSNGSCATPCTTPHTLCTTPGCVCLTDSSGANYCVSPTGGAGGPCSSDSDCPSGQGCFLLVGPGEAICGPLC